MSAEPGQQQVLCPKCGVAYRWRADMARKKVLCPCGIKFRMPFQPGQEMIIVTPQGEFPASEYLAQNPPSDQSPSNPSGNGASATLEASSLGPPAAPQTPPRPASSSASAISKAVFDSPQPRPGSGVSPSVNRPRPAAPATKAQPPSESPPDISIPLDLNLETTSPPPSQPPDRGAIGLADDGAIGLSDDGGIDLADDGKLDLAGDESPPEPASLDDGALDLDIPLEAAAPPAAPEPPATSLLQPKPRPQSNEYDIDPVPEPVGPATAAPATKTCPGCKKEVAADSLLCVNCGYNLIAKPAAKKPKPKAPKAPPRPKTPEELEIEAKMRVKDVYVPLVLAAVGAAMLLFNIFFLCPWNDSLADAREKARQEKLDSQPASFLAGLDNPSDQADEDSSDQAKSDSGDQVKPKDAADDSPKPAKKKRKHKKHVDPEPDLDPTPPPPPPAPPPPADPTPAPDDGSGTHHLRRLTEIKDPTAPAPTTPAPTSGTPEAAAAPDAAAAAATAPSTAPATQPAKKHKKKTEEATPFQKGLARVITGGWTILFGMVFGYMGLIALSKLFDTSYEGSLGIVLKLLAIATVMTGLIDISYTSMDIASDGAGWLLGFYVANPIGMAVFWAMTAYLFEFTLIEIGFFFGINFVITHGLMFFLQALMMS